MNAPAMTIDRSTRSPRLRRATTALVAVVLAVTAATPVAAAAPANDLPAGAVVITALPFTINQDTTEATVGVDDVGCGAGGLDVATVWYSFTPSEDVRVEIDARASDYLVGVSLFAGTADEAGRFDCNNYALAFDAAAGTTYYILFAGLDDLVNGGLLRADIEVAPPSLGMTLTVDPTAKVHPKTGEALITGTAACDREADFAEVTVTLRLETGRFVTIGAGSGQTACGPASSNWAAIVSGENGRFIGGEATVQLTGLACDILSCNETLGSGSVRLSRGTFELPAVVGARTSTAAAAAAPANDDIGSPIVIGALPYSGSLDTTGATTGTSDPGYCDAPEFGQDPGSVWYAYTAAESGSLLATTFGSDYDTTLYVGTADGSGGMTVLGCNDDTQSHASAVRFDAVAGETYLFSVASSPFGGSAGGNLVFNLDVGPPAQAVTLHVDPVGSFTRYGVATIRGTVSCAAPAQWPLIVVELMQRVGNREIPATAFLDLEGCPAAEIPFAAEISSPYGKFLGGHAMAQVIFAACSVFECGSEMVDLQVSLRR